MNSANPNEPWYRQFWPWFIMVPPLAAILASGVTIWLAVSNPPDLVVPDYARIAETVALNQQLDAYAGQLGLQALVRLESLDGSYNRSVSLLLTQQSGDPMMQNEILLRLVHPTRPEFDRTVLLVKDQDKYRGAVDIPALKYTLQIEDTAGTWRLSSPINQQTSSLTFGTGQ